MSESLSVCMFVYVYVCVRSCMCVCVCVSACVCVYMSSYKFYIYVNLFVCKMHICTLSAHALSEAYTYTYTLGCALYNAHILGRILRCWVFSFFNFTLKKFELLTSNLSLTICFNYLTNVIDNSYNMSSPYKHIKARNKRLKEVNRNID